MQDIEKAMAREEEYLAHRMRGEEPFHLVDAVRECGFASLEAYSDAKSDYKFSRLSFDFVEKTPPECMAEVFRMIETRTTGALFVDSDRTFVFNGTASLNSGYCEDRGIQVLPIGTNGGTIVCTDGDFSLGVCCPYEVGVGSAYILEKLADILKRHTDEGVAVAGNDVLVGGRKVLGSASYSRNGVFMFVCHVSFSDKTDLIAEICTTEKIGKPVGYIGFMPRSEFRREVSEWLRVRSI